MIVNTYKDVNDALLDVAKHIQERYRKVVKYLAFVCIPLIVLGFFQAWLWMLSILIMVSILIPYRKSNIITLSVGFEYARHNILHYTVLVEAVDFIGVAYNQKAYAYYENSGNEPEFYLPKAERISATQAGLRLTDAGWTVDRLTSHTYCRRVSLLGRVV